MLEPETIFLPTEVKKIVEPYVDLGNLLLVDNDPLSDSDKKGKISEDDLARRVRDNVQYLFNKVWDLERVRVVDALCAKLPAPSLRLPREKPLPEKRQLTKWEKYAQDKGISKSPKDRKLFDKETEEWKPRYGYRRGKDDTKDWLIEIPDHKDPMADYFEERKQAKGERASKNEMQRLRNFARRGKATAANAEPIGVSKNLEDRSRHELVNQINRARFSTASVGKFQPELKKEKKYVKSEKRHQYQPNEKANEERTKHLEILKKLSSKKPNINQDQLASVSKNVRQENWSKKPLSKQKRSKSTIDRQQYYRSKVKNNKGHSSSGPTGAKPRKKITGKKR